MQTFILYRIFVSLLVWLLLLTHYRYRELLLHLITLNDTHTHTHTLGRTSVDERSVRRRYLYLTTRKILKRQTSMPQVGFEPAILASERPQSYTLDCWIGCIGVAAIK
jgi:hypothetical protein